MKTETKNKVYESPQALELQLAPEGVLCASGAEMNNFTRNDDSLEW